MGRLLQVLEQNATSMLVLQLQETLGALVLPLGQLAGAVAHALQSHLIRVEIEAQRGRCRRLQMQVDQGVDSSLYLGGIILTIWGALGCLAK